MARPGRSSIRSLNVADAKQQLSALLGRVAYGGESVVIMKRGVPMAKLVPVGEAAEAHLADVVGWLDDDAPFFAAVADVVEARRDRQPRAVPAARRRGRDRA